MWRDHNRRSPFPYPASLPHLPVAFQTRRRVFRGRNFGERGHNRIGDSRLLLLLFAGDRREVRECAGSAVYRRSDLPGRLLSPQLEFLAGFRLPRRVVTEISTISEPQLKHRFSWICVLCYTPGSPAPLFQVLRSKLDESAGER